MVPAAVHYTALAAALLVAVGLVREAGPRLTRALPESHRISGVPLTQGRPDWCGPAALAAVLQYHGDEATAEELAGAIFLPGYRGTLNLDLLLWAKQRGFAAQAGPGTKADLRQAVAADRPVICMVRRRDPVADRNHFVVVQGYDDARRVWWVDGGSGRVGEVPMSDFARDWEDCGRWLLVIEGRQAKQERVSPDDR